MVWSYASALPYFFMLWQLIKDTPLHIILQYIGPIQMS